ncbi:MAG: metallophosphoesterase [Cyanobacteria bacterium P01_A01_bin.135]
MKLITDPPIARKISLMRQRMRCHHAEIKARNIDPMRLALASDSKGSEGAFSFLVIGDTGTGRHRGNNPQRRVAEQMIAQTGECDFVLHTGDVVYLVGSSEQYPENFIKPYRELLVGGERYKRLRFDRLVFNTPMFLVPGNHDYYDLPLALGITAQVMAPLRYLLRRQVDLDIGLHGSRCGDAYSRAFLDYPKPMGPGQMAQHLDQHYTTQTDTGRCLTYQPGTFTRLPNRYYWFRHQGIEFYALDSNTINGPEVVPDTATGEAQRDRLQAQRAQWERQQAEIIEKATTLDPSKPDEAERLNDLQAKYEQVDEEIRDAQKQLTRTPQTADDVDSEQLNWLQQRLIESWNTEGVRGRVVFFHHPPYITEATKWNQGQTLAVRHRLRWVFDQVQASVGGALGDRPVVDLVLSGHAHCFDYLRTEDTGRGDAGIAWVVCGGSGYSLRRQRLEGDIIFEELDGIERPVARSQLFLGRSGHGSEKRRPYSFARINVSADTPARFTVEPRVVEMEASREWQNYTLDSIEI